MYKLIAICCAAAASFSTLAHDPFKPEKENECKIYHQDKYPKNAFALCDSYCNPQSAIWDEDCDKKTPAERLAAFQALGIGDPICVAPKRAYVTNFNSNQVFLCQLGLDGNFIGCKDLSLSTQFCDTSFVQPVQVELNKDEDIAYITNYGSNTVSKCKINNNPCSTIGEFSECKDSGAGAVFYKPFGIVLNKAENIAYVTNNEGSPEVSKCSVNHHGAFTGCVNSGATPLIEPRPTGIILSKHGSFAYVENDEGHQVKKCTINAGGFLTNCNATGSGFSKPIGIASNGKFAYITDRDTSTVVKCLIDTVPGPTLGNLITCTDSGAVFNSPIGIALNKLGNTAYVTNIGNNRISKCTIDTNPISPTYGAFTACEDSGCGVLFDQPYGVTLVY